MSSSIQYDVRGNGPVMPEIRLLVTDLDGTLVGNGETPADFQRFRECLGDLRSRHRTRWAIITGRHMRALRPMVGQFRVWGLVPDYAVVEDARIFERGPGGRLVPFLFWNARIDVLRFAVNRGYRRTLRTWLRELRMYFPHAEDLSRHGIDIWMRLPGEEEARHAEAMLQNNVRTIRRNRFFVFRWGTEVCLASSVGTKGEALQRICRKLQLPQSSVFAVGDGANDISMLSGQAAGMTACVANASGHVRETVLSAGGMVSTRNGIHGVLEAVERYTGREAGAGSATA